MYPRPYVGFVCICGDFLVFCWLGFAGVGIEGFVPSLYGTQISHKTCCSVFARQNFHDNSRLVCCLYVLLYGYVMSPDCFVGHFMSRWF